MIPEIVDAVAERLAPYGWSVYFGRQRTTSKIPTQNTIQVLIADGGDDFDPEMLLDSVGLNMWEGVEVRIQAVDATGKADERKQRAAIRSMVRRFLAAFDIERDARDLKWRNITGGPPGIGAAAQEIGAQYVLLFQVGSQIGAEEPLRAADDQVTADTLNVSLGDVTEQACP